MNAVASQYNFKEALFELLLSNDKDIEFLNNSLREIILQFGSETHDNINCIEKIGFGKRNKIIHIDNFGLLKNEELFLSYKSLFNYLKKEIPTPLLEAFPEMTFNEYKRVINSTYDIFSDLTTDCSFLKSYNLLLRKFSYQELEKSKGLFQTYSTNKENRKRKFHYKPNLFYDAFEKRNRFGFSFKFGDHMLLISDFWREMECIAVPEALNDLTNSDWEALNRFIVLLTLDLEK